MSSVAEPAPQQLRPRLAARTGRRRHRASPARSQRSCCGAIPASSCGRHRALGRGRAPERSLPALPRAAHGAGARPRPPCRRRRGRRRLPSRGRRPHRGALRERGVRVVDLCADFRLRELATYERWYGAHPQPGLLERGRLRADRAAPRGDRAAAIVANPGCYPTAALLALAPLARVGLIADVVIDAKQGISGAGRAFDATRTSPTRARTSSPTRSPRTATRRRSSSSSTMLDPTHPGSRGAVQAASRAARPGGARELLCDAHANGGAHGTRRALPRRLRGRAVRRGVR